MCTLNITVKEYVESQETLGSYNPKYYISSVSSVSGEFTSIETADAIVSLEVEPMVGIVFTIGGRTRQIMFEIPKRIIEKPRSELAQEIWIFRSNQLSRLLKTGYS